MPNWNNIWGSSFSVRFGSFVRESYVAGSVGTTS